MSVKAIFRKYTSYKEALEDYANLMEYGLSHNKNFYHGAKKVILKTYEEATKFLTLVNMQQILITTRNSIR